MSYQLKSARYLARELVLKILRPGDAAVDATMGNGHDTEMLCEAVGQEGRVYAFDVQEQAVVSTEERLRRTNLIERARLFQLGHEHMAEKVPEKVRVVMFNLGWLPGGDHSVTTRTETTLRAVRAALDLLLPLGMLVICVYPGHPEGEREGKELTDLLSGLSNREFNVLRQSFPNAGPGAPECFAVQKNASQDVDKAPRAAV